MENASSASLFFTFSFFFSFFTPSYFLRHPLFLFSLTSLPTILPFSSSSTSNFLSSSPHSLSPFPFYLLVTLYHAAQLIPNVFIYVAFIPEWEISSSQYNACTITEKYEDEGFEPLFQCKSGHQDWLYGSL